MTIKQQGGIFGRNPTFNDVDVEGNLTVGGSSISAVGTIASQDADSVNIDGGNIDGTTIGLSNASGGTFSNATVENDLKVGRFLQMKDSGGSFRTNMYLTTDDLILSTGTSSGSRSIIFQTEGQERWRVNAAGNMVPATSGLGIDFSATSGTGTSELFDDYEEGTWTPAFDTTNGDLDVGTGTISTSLAKYTKIGNRVFLEARFSMSSPFTSVGTGDAIITGLPFASSSTGGVVSSVKIGYAYRFATAAPISGYTTGSEIRLLTTAYTTASSFTAMPAANLNITGSNKNVIALSVNYEAV